MTPNARRRRMSSVMRVLLLSLVAFASSTGWAEAVPILRSSNFFAPHARLCTYNYVLRHLRPALPSEVAGW